MINVTCSSMPEFEEYTNEIKELWDSHWLTNMGCKHQKLQRLLEEKLGCPYVILFTNGHLALEGMLSAFGFPQGSEVITTPYTFASTTHAIVRSGLTPVFCDIDPVSFCMAPDRIERLITDKTVAILPVHVYGNVCDVEAIDAIAQRHHLKVFYDAAHAFGVKYKGKSVACFGDVSMFSFHATKVFNTIEGGALCFKDDALVTPLNDLKNFGIHGPESVMYVGGNAKMNEFQAAMGICNLRHFDEEIAKRRKVFERYVSHLENVEGIRINKIQVDVNSNYAYFPVIFDGDKYDRDDIAEKLYMNNILARKYFYPITNSFECYRGYPTADPDLTPIAKKTSNHVLTLPLYANLAMEDVDRICDLIIYK